MKRQSYIPPEYKKSAFTCPHCYVYANHSWGKLDAKIDNHMIRIPDFTVSRCLHCQNFCIWKEGQPIYPYISQAPFPNPDLPEEIKKNFEEARSIINTCPCGAAAILRVCIKKLCQHLGGSGENLTKDIASLIEKGLNPKIQDNLNILHVTGSEAVTPGMLDVRDGFGTAVQLCQLINIIADAAISQPKKVEELNKQLSEAKNQPAK